MTKRVKLGRRKLKKIQVIVTDEIYRWLNKLASERGVTLDDLFNEHVDYLKSQYDLVQTA